jgi:hypothetical protein
MKPLELTDPVGAPRPWRPLERLGLALINDERDLPFFTLSLAITLVMLPFAATFFVPGWFRWWLAPVYLALVAFGYLDRYILMLHNTSHRRMYKASVGFMNHYIPRVLGLFFGETPDTYFTHHVGMHHVEGNLPNDLSTTMPFRRDSLLDFLRYFLRFFCFAVAELPLYFYRRGRRELFRRSLFGELSAYVVYAVALWANWRAALVVLLIPFVATRFLMMAGNWGQHAFVDESDPGSDFLSSCTCINTRYNRRCFNDGYHIGHHVKPTRHWTEMPGDLLASQAEYAQKGALVFEGIDFFGIWLMLMLKQHRALARRVVHLGDGPAPSLDEVEATLRRRLRRFEAAELAALVAA